MTKHTPGPWEWNGRHTVNATLPSGRLVAETLLASDARLIAQAPAMLEELQEAESLLTAIGKGYPDIGTDSRFQNRMKSIRAILAAIDGE